MSELFAAVLFAAPLLTLGFAMGRVARRHAMPRHDHVWGNWELVTKVLTKVPASYGDSFLDGIFGGSSRVEDRDCQQRECLGCGWIERRLL